MTQDNFDYSSEPPAFGHAMLKYFPFEKSYLNFNNGSYGSPPLPVLAAADKIGRDIEAQPDLYLRYTYIPLLNEARAKLAKLIGADEDECVLVNNATHGVNTVLRNIDWSEDDYIVGTTVTYGAVSRSMRYVADTKPHPKLAPVQLNFPTTTSEILTNFRKHLQDLPRKPGSKVVAVLDAIVSNPGVQLPWKELVKICKEEDAISIVDAAHSIGQEYRINLKEADPDFWVSNCHKWLYAKRGCAVFYVPKRNQHLIRTTLPTSFGYVSPADAPGGPEAPNFIEQFEWTGTMDYTSYLSVPAALRFREWIGGEEKINAYCHSLAIKGGQELAAQLGTRVMDPNGEFTAHMVNVEIPLQGVSFSEGVKDKIDHILLEEWNMYVAYFFHNGKWWVRCSVQVWNEISDFERLGKALLDICDKLSVKE